jgi:hypothetical protein
MAYSQVPVSESQVASNPDTSIENLLYEKWKILCGTTNGQFKTAGKYRYDKRIPALDVETNK